MLDGSAVRTLDTIGSVVNFDVCCEVLHSTILDCSYDSVQQEREAICWDPETAIYACYHHETQMTGTNQNAQRPVLFPKTMAVAPRQIAT